MKKYDKVKVVYVIFTSGLHVAFDDSVLKTDFLKNIDKYIKR